MNSQYVIIKKKNNFGNGPTIFDPVIRPDNQPDIRFGHINKQIWTKFGRGMYNVILKHAWKFQLDPNVRQDIRFINILSKALFDLR